MARGITIFASRSPAPTATITARRLLRESATAPAARWWNALLRAHSCATSSTSSTGLSGGSVSTRKEKGSVKGKNVLMISTCLLVRELVEEGALQCSTLYLDPARAEREDGDKGGAVH